MGGQLWEHTSLALLTQAITLAANAERGRGVKSVIEDRCGQDGVGEEAAPLAIRLVRGEDDAALELGLRDELEEEPGSSSGTMGSDQLILVPARCLVQGGDFRSDHSGEFTGDHDTENSSGRRWVGVSPRFPRGHGFRDLSRSQIWLARTG